MVRASHERNSMKHRHIWHWHTDECKASEICTPCLFSGGIVVRRDAPQMHVTARYSYVHDPYLPVAVTLTNHVDTIAAKKEHPYAQGTSNE